MWPSMTQQRNKGPGSAGVPSKDNLGSDDDTFGYLRTQQIPAYGSLSNTTSMNDNPYLAPAGNYYPFPYGLGDGNTAWSSGGEPMFSFGNYGHAGGLGHAAAGSLHGQTNDHHTSMYGAGPGAAAAAAADFGNSFGYGSHPAAAAPGFSFFPTAAGEYDTWGTGGRATGKAFDDYYRTPAALGPLTASVATSSAASTVTGPFDYGAVNGDTAFGTGPGGVHDGLKNLDQTMGGLSIGGGDKSSVLPPLGVSSVGEGSLVSQKDVFQGGIVGVAGTVGGGDHVGIGGGSGSGGVNVASLGGGGLTSPHTPLMPPSSNSVGLSGGGGGLDGSIPPGPGGLGTSGGVGGLISSAGSHVVSGAGGGSASVGAPHSSPTQAPPAPSSAPAKKSWASIASQPAKPQPKIKAKTIPPAPVLVTRNAGNMDIGTWGDPGVARSNSGERSLSGKDVSGAGKSSGGSAAPRNAWGTAAPRQGGRVGNEGAQVGGKSNNRNDVVGNNPNGTGSPHANGKSGPGTLATCANGPNPPEENVPTVLKELMVTHKYNPKDYNLSPRNARFFVIKSYSEDDIHRSIKYGIWCSTEHGNKRLDEAFRTQDTKGPVLLFFSVNGSGHFCGMAQMMGHVDYDTSSRVWLQDKWKGQFQVKWIYVKDVPNSQLRHIRLENNENKPVTNSRDTQEILGEKGKQVLKIIHSYKHSTSIFDDFGHYEKRQEVETYRDDVVGPPKPTAPPTANNPQRK